MINETIVVLKDRYEALLAAEAKSARLAERVAQFVEVELQEYAIAQRIRAFALTLPEPSHEP